jgi:polysaccharide biosynthesis/export protein
MLLAMRSKIPQAIYAMAKCVSLRRFCENGLAACLERRRAWRSLRAAAVGVWIVTGTLTLACGAIRAEAQDLGGGAPAQEAPPITPAINAPTQDTTPQPLFPQSPYPGPSTQPQSRAGVPLGPSLGAGLGFGPIRSGDVVEVQVFDSPEYNVRMPVSASGDIAIPYAGLFHIEGMTSIQAADAITSLFREREILRDPRVIVTTQQFGYSVTVLGEVRSPGIYALAGRKRLIDVLTEAGGITDRAGHVIEVFGADTMKNPKALLWDPTLRENDNAEVTLSAGETVMVSRCGVVYVGGNVTRPGAYPLCDSNHTTLTEVLALAQGVRPSSYPQRTILFRESSSGTRVMEKVRLDDVLRGKKTDITMQPDDILFVPPSNLKAAGKTIIISAVGFATQAFFFFQP